MSITITDPVLLAQLKEQQGSVDLFGPNGEFVGTFQIPIGTPPPGFQSPYTPEQIAEFRKLRSGRPLEDIIRDLESRGRG